MATQTFVCCETLASGCQVSPVCGSIVKTLDLIPWRHRFPIQKFRKGLEEPENQSIPATWAAQGGLMAFFARQPAQSQSSKNCKVRYISAYPFWRGFLCRLRQSMDMLKRGDGMHEVKVYDVSGKLKRVISTQELNIRSQEQMDSPFLFRKNKSTRKLLIKPPETQAKTGI